MFQGRAIACWLPVVFYFWGNGVQAKMKRDGGSDQEVQHPMMLIRYDYNGYVQLATHNIQIWEE